MINDGLQKSVHCIFSKGICLGQYQEDIARMYDTSISKCFSTGRCASIANDNKGMVGHLLGKRLTARDERSFLASWRERVCSKGKTSVFFQTKSCVLCSPSIEKQIQSLGLVSDMQSPRFGGFAAEVGAAILPSPKNCGSGCPRLSMKIRVTYIRPGGTL